MSVYELCMRERAESTFLQMFYSALWHSLKRCGWLGSCDWKLSYDGWDQEHITEKLGGISKTNKQTKTFMVIIWYRKGQTIKFVHQESEIFNVLPMLYFSRSSIKSANMQLLSQFNKPIHKYLNPRERWLYADNVSDLSRQKGKSLASIWLWPVFSRHM